MKFLPLALLCLSLPCGFATGAQEPPADAPSSFPINLDKTPKGGIEGNGNDAPLPDQSTPFNAAKLLLRALQEKTDWTAEPYKSLPATSPFVGPLKLKSILSRMEAVQAYVTASSPERPPFVDEASIIMDGDLAMAYIMLPDRTNPYVYAATAVALVKKNGEWKASLTPGSFDNTFLPFNDHVRQRAAQISTEAKKKIFGLAHQYSVAAVKKALEHIKRFRVEAVKGKSDDEIKKLLIRTVKEGDPARIAALLVAPYYMESAITQSARLTPVVKAMRLQDRNQENRYIQPTNLSFMAFPNTILVPLQPHPDDQLDPNKRNEQPERNKNEAKKTDKDIHSIAAMTILPPRMSLPDLDKPALIYRYALEKIQDPTDGFPVFKMYVGDAFSSWNLKPDESTTSRIIADFHRTYSPLAYAEPKEAVSAAGRALEAGDSLTLIRMLAPSRFASVPEFEEALTQLKAVMSKEELQPASRNRKDYKPTLKGAFELKDGGTSLKATIGLKPNLKSDFTRCNLYFTRTEKGWMLTGADDENPLKL